MKEFLTIYNNTLLYLENGEVKYHLITDDVIFAHHTNDKNYFAWNEQCTYDNNDYTVSNKLPSDYYLIINKSTWKVVNIYDSKLTLYGSMKSYNDLIVYNESYLSQPTLDIVMIADGKIVTYDDKKVYDTGLHGLSYHIGYNFNDSNITHLTKPEYYWIDGKLKEVWFTSEKCLYVHNYIYDKANCRRDYTIDNIGVLSNI